MSENLTSLSRSRNMSAIPSKNSKPELRVRSLLHKMGYRFRLHRKDLPGSPDIVLPIWRTAIFVHGCFWHCHFCRKGKSTPKTNAQFWAAKRQRNTLRDAEVQKQLRKQHWTVITIWECQTQPVEKLIALLRRFKF
jgi:DNA mismatch endonuclease, patch repair protein